MDSSCKLDEEVELQIPHKELLLNESNQCDFDNLTESIDKITFKQAIYEISINFFPSCLSLLVEFGVTCANIIFIGMLDDPVLISGCGLGNTTMGLIVYSVDIGICGGIDTLVSQAFGRKEYKLCGVYLNTSRIIIVITFIFQTMILVNSKEIFVSLGLPVESAEIAQNYTLWILPGSFFQMQFECLRRFLLVQEIFNPVLYVLISTLCMHIILLYVLVIQFRLDINGIGIATTCTFILNFISLTLYVHFNKNLIPKESWHFINKDAFSKLIEYLKYGVPACLMLLLDWWAYELLNIIAGMIGVKELAASVIIFNIVVWIFLIPLGVSYATTSLIGNSLGANKPNTAKIYTQAVLLFGTILNIIVFSPILLCRKTIISIYTTDEQVFEYIDSAFVLIAIGIFTDMMQGMMDGVIRAMGFQNVATLWELVSYWAVMTPFAYLFAFCFDFGFIGVWIGLPCGSILLLSAFLWILATANWKHLAEEASKIKEN